MDGKSTLQQISTLAIIREISDSDLEIGRYNLKSGVSRIIRESWQHFESLQDSEKLNTYPSPNPTPHSDIIVH